MNDPQKPRLIEWRLPLQWILTVLGMCAATALGFAIWKSSMESRVATLESDAAARKKSDEAASRMVWQVEAMARDFGEMKEAVKAISNQNMDIWMLQREIQDINCRTGGRCIETVGRKGK